ncbi:MAG: thiamine phosphate synthase [Ruminococcus sp.]|nr:thiamine phosphate synthase [Ruminococcus sp.]
MEFNRDLLTLYAITDRGCLGGRDLCEAVESAIKGGATMIQLRDKELSERELIREAKMLKEVCQKYNVPLIINDNFRAALVAKVDGAHVGLHDTPVSVIRQMAGKDFIIGATAKTVTQAKAAEKAGANYLGVGAVFPSPTKENALRITPQLFREISQSVSIPSAAIGGINKDNIMALAGCGAAGFAVVSAVFGQEDIQAAAEQIRMLADTFRS